MNTNYNYLKQRTFAIFFYIFYCFLWISLIPSFFAGKMLLEPIVVGEFPLAPIITFPSSVVMVLNAVFRKEHKLFYAIMVILIFIPFFVVGLIAKNSN